VSYEAWQLEVMPVEPPLSSSPVNQHRENEYRDYPVSQGPIDDCSQFPKHSSGEFADNVHLITLREQFARERGMI
jgi:hypothetical protein